MHIMTELGWTPFQIKTEPVEQAAIRNSLDPYVIDFTSLNDCISFAKYCRGDWVVLKEYGTPQYRIVERSKMPLYEGEFVWPSI